MSFLPLVTIYIVSKNYSSYIKDAISSALTQDYINTELIIIDDCSTDGSPELIASVTEGLDITCIYNPKSIGLIRCSNAALRISNGEYIIRLDADDCLLSDAITNLVYCAMQNPNAAMVYGNYIEISDNGDYIANVIAPEPDHCRFQGIAPHGACTLFSTLALNSIGGYSERHDRQDGYYAWLMLSSKYTILKDENIIFYYRKHSQSLSYSRSKLLDVRYEILSDTYSLFHSKDNVKVSAVLLFRDIDRYLSFHHSSVSASSCDPLGTILDSLFSIDCITDVYIYSDPSCPLVLHYLHQYPNLNLIGWDETLHSPSAHPTSLASFYRFFAEKLRSNGYGQDDLMLTISDQYPLLPKKFLQAIVHSTIVFSTSETISCSIYESEAYAHNGISLNNTSLDSTRYSRQPIFVHEGGLRCMRLSVPCRGVLDSSHSRACLEIDKVSLYKSSLHNLAY